MQTTVFLIRHGVTDWHRARKVLGQRDIGLNAEGINQADDAARVLAGARLGEVISSPLQRAVQTAEVVAGPHGLQVARDPRLTDLRAGRWEGLTFDEVDASPDYQRFVADPLSERIPGGEDLNQIRDRGVAAIEQAIEDSPAGENVAVVTHAGIVRVVLAHYLGMSLACYHRLRVSAGSISVMRFGVGALPRVLAVNWRGSFGELL